VWIVQEIIVDKRPDFIIETGTLCGGSAALWATILEQVNPEERVITIDILDQAQQARKLPIVQKHVDFLLGSSTAADIVNEVKKRVEGKAEADSGMSSALRSVGLLDVLSSALPGPSVALAKSSQMRLVSMPVCGSSLRNLVRNVG
jgi:hypothetical protein